MNGCNSGNGVQPANEGLQTIAIHAGQDPEQWETLSVVPPLVMSTTFKQHVPGKPKMYEYGRSGNPTRRCLEACLAGVEGAQHALCFASGLGATTALMSLLDAGDHVVCCDDVYGGTNRLLSKVFSRHGVQTTLADLSSLDELQAALRPTTKIVWLESPTNPTLKTVDIRAVVDVCRQAEQQQQHQRILVAVDNTFLTPYFQRPLELGADLVVYSLTKYMNGHSDVIMGSIATNDAGLHERLAFLQNAMGIVPSPFDCYMVNRGLKTLVVRMQAHFRNGLAVARYLEAHPKVGRVLHPGLESHPQHAVYKRQTSGHSGVFSFYLAGKDTDGGLKAARTFLAALRVFTLAESLGGYESLAELPSVMTHAAVPEEQRAKLNITDSLIRLSVGLESVPDLIADLEQALAQI